MAKSEGKAIDGIYLGDFEGFVGRRDALAKQLRSDRDAEAADRVRALKKPSRTAWAVNQFAAQGKKLRTELLKAGTALREAQEGLVSGDADREALLKARDRERVAVSAAVEAIEALAGEAGPALNAAATERVRQTLHAVALDEDVREQFEAARLTTDHEASGLGGEEGAGQAQARQEGRAEAPAAGTAEGGGGRRDQARTRAGDGRAGAVRGHQGIRAGAGRSQARDQAARPGAEGGGHGDGARGWPALELTIPPQPARIRAVRAKRAEERHDDS